MFIAMSDVTRILAQIEQGDPQAAEKLLPLVYDELRRLAAAKLARESPGQTLQATALVHEAYVRLVGGPSPPVFAGRTHFFRTAAEAMRRVLVDAARRKQSGKRGGELKRMEMVEPAAGQSLPAEDVIAVSEALHKLQQHDATKAELVKLRYFVGLTLTEAAEVLGISRATADRYWAYAKIWLYRELQEIAGDRRDSVSEQAS